MSNANPKREEIWTKEYFRKEFGEQTHILINCKNNAEIGKVAMKLFWDGFKAEAVRLATDR